MTRFEASELRDQWIREGNLPCAHLRLGLEHTEKGYLTGAFICVICGREINETSPIDTQVK